MNKHILLSLVWLLAALVTHARRTYPITADSVSIYIILRTLLG